MNITKPEQMLSGTFKLKEAVNKFEKEFTKEEKDLEYYHLIIDGEYNRQTCNKIETLYSKSGWNKVKCKTSSENGERAGLTSLQLWREDICKQSKPIELNEIEISDYLINKKIECSTLLSKENWKRLLNSDARIKKILNEWKNYNIKIKIYSLLHRGLHSPKELGYTNFFYDIKSEMYKSYSMDITRNITVFERNKYGKECTGILRTIDLPLSMYLTVIRADIQNKN